MAINRRELLTFFSAAGLCAAVPTLAKNNQQWIIGACRLGDKQYGLSACDLSGHIKWQQPLPARGHDVALHNTKPIGIAIARRPEQWLQLFNTDTGRILHSLNTPSALVLNGHAVWHGDNLIVTASNKIDSTLRLMRFNLSHDQLVLKQIKTFAHVGPHELVRHNHHLFIAVGGLHTHGRDVLNKEHFESGLLTLDANTLAPIQYVSSPAQHVSLRHLSVNEIGQVFIAGQYQLDTNQSEPLLYALQGDSLLPFPNDPSLWPRLKGYLGSILAVGNKVIVTSPRAHWIGTFDTHAKTLQNQLLSHDICALALSGGEIIAGTGTGKLWVGNQAMQSHIIWDNHFEAYSSS